MGGGEAEKKSYRVTSWREYNESLVRRGSPRTCLVSRYSPLGNTTTRRPAAATRSSTARVSRSTAAIETPLTLRELFRLPCRQTKLVGRALTLVGVGVVIPHHTSLAKRAAKLDIDTQLAHWEGPIDMVVDSTGLKVYDEGD